MSSQPLLNNASESPSSPQHVARVTLRGCYELMRWHKPFIGNTLTFWPCAWGITMAALANHTPPRSLILQTIKFGISSLLLHSGGCVWNDICDVRFDKQVERTKRRPLPSGRVTTGQAWVLLVLVVTAYAITLPAPNNTTAILGCIWVFPLTGLYPLTKRWTNWPQAWLGLAMNFGFPIAWTSQTGEVQSIVVWTMYLGTVCWTIVYDTMYAVQDRKDDVKAGIKSTAVLFSDWVRPILSIFAASFVALLVFSGIWNGQGPTYFVVSCGGTGIHMAWQLLAWKVGEGADDDAKFNSNGFIGLLIFVGVALDYSLQRT
ncbi:UbiA prenyltransferase [Leucogyrophana mollusca]|uniref:UbiA prenyltransferase n=1 Tax=Leucogyrophana mollusca TaxID=85980 RepID=A0ACB8BCN3_9AGAM|nr:UbiA prenyltransferase [Leucogyrophana mollusca]